MAIATAISASAANSTTRSRYIGATRSNFYNQVMGHAPVACLYQHKLTTTNEIARPAARATGPYLRSDAAAPRTRARMGRTQGDRLVSTPATNARAIAPTFIDQGQPASVEEDLLRLE